MADITQDVVLAYLGKSTDPRPGTYDTIIKLLPGETVQQAINAANAPNSTRKLYTNADNYSNVRVKPITPSTSGFVAHSRTKFYFGLTPYLHDYDSVTGGIQANYRQLLLKTGPNDVGFNCAFLTVQWRKHEVGAVGNYNWKIMDTAIDTCREAGLTVFLRFDMTRDGDTNTMTNGDLWIPEGHQQVDMENNVARGEGGRRVWSYDSPLLLTRMTSFVTDALNRINASGNAGIVAGVSVTTNPRFEGAFNFANDVNQARQDALFDYSYWGKEGFRQSMKTKYAGNLTAANQAWGRSYASFEALTPPVPAKIGTANWNFTENRFSRDWYWHRMMSVVKVLNAAHYLVKSLYPNLMTIGEDGNLTDYLAQARASDGLMAHYEGDMFKNNDQPSTFIELNAQLARRDGKSAGNELESPHNHSIAESVDWVKRGYLAGCVLYDYANFGLMPGADGSPTFVEDTAAYLRQFKAALNAAGVIIGAEVPLEQAGTMTVNLSESVQWRWNNAINGGPSLLQRFTAQIVNGKYPKVTHVDDL